jgi:hypothetical protein
MQRKILTVFAILAQGCSPSLEIPGGRDAGTVGLLLEPKGCCVVREGFRFSFPQPPAAPFPLMFQGELSDYHRARLDAELSSTLVARRVALGSAGEWFAPLDPLIPGQLYSIAWSEQEVFQVEVKAARGAPFSRVWPRDSEPTRLAVFCSERADRGAEVDLPDGLAALVVAGDNRCFALLAAAGRAPALSPARLFGQSVQTTVLSGTTTRWADAKLPECGAGSSRFGIGCAEVTDDRLYIDASVDSFWFVSGAASASLAAGPELRPVLRGLVPGTNAELALRIFLRDGTELVATPSVVTGQQRPHVVINEVFADALGPEPAQEWLELVNDGARAVELSELGVVDGGSNEPGWLPPHLLEPGAFALVVREDFDAAGTWDAPPLARTSILRVPELGSNGLSNSGERIALVARNGSTVSSVPALSSRSGTSWARVEPSCADVPECFALHADPGASPGAPNVTGE